MQLTCPECGERTPAQNINIERMAAVCPVCDTIFQFDPPGEKAKRRKIKQPANLAVSESDDTQTLSFRTNFRLDRNENFITTGILSAIFTLGTIASIEDFIAGEMTVFILLAISLITVFIYYLLALIVYNKTHIEMDETQIRVSRHPLPPLFNSPNRINLAGIKHIHYVETAASVKEGYDTPRYNVYALMQDGTQKIIISDLIDDYAVFITQRLNADLEAGAAPHLAQQIDDALPADNVQIDDIFYAEKSGRKQH